MITAGVLIAPFYVAPHRRDTSRLIAKRARESSTPRTFIHTAEAVRVAGERTCSARVRIVVLAVCHATPSNCATRKTDMNSHPRA